MAGYAVFRVARFLLGFRKIALQPAPSASDLSGHE
jgi:hypothetical protein